MQGSAGASVAHNLVAADGTFPLFRRYRHCTFSPSHVFNFNETLRDFKQTNISERYVYFCVTVFTHFCYIVNAKQLYQRCK